ncbi:BZ3500_MvSof-1268-A1-R1_Chr11-1g03277 [Microbotryum saponariae]|uniref:BZ3500_MvSof-1268-A1-R1_Chr11-1g03277 protein n=1 Tax=Microbotryum saponariae TaxID=289078 RepID=A0A2X0N933_9BASI|nr:BZ3501_MvSof-1269-A2-R1_Chr11g02852 [Microbotryum saponariae]SDA03872.1 BZ3500_MvSof-1268-A1-R1_Chr11-1g03277 [Microbotryum saponariae]
MTLLRATRHTANLSWRSFSSCCSCRSPAPDGVAYKAPIAAGRLPAYDEALKLLQADRDDKLQRLAKLKTQGDVEQSVLDKLEVEAWVNDPETRWRAKHGHGDPTKAVYRHLAEMKWRREGALAILMQRVTQMSLVPDVLPEFDPVLDVQISVAEHSQEPLQPGVFTLPRQVSRREGRSRTSLQTTFIDSVFIQTREPFKISAQVFHPEERLYTLLMVDPDVPDQLNRTFTTTLHWLVKADLSPSPALIPYLPPHPQQGTPYHRYTLVLLEQKQALGLAPEAVERTDFSVREFMRQNDLTASGMSFFRQKWGEDVSAIYREILGAEPPRFARPLKIDTYAGRPAKYDLL